MAKPRLQPPDNVQLSSLLTIRGRRAAHVWLRDVLGVPVSFNYVRDCIARDEVRYTKVAGCKMFTTQDLFDWAAGLGGTTERHI